MAQLLMQVEEEPDAMPDLRTSKNLDRAIRSAGIALWAWNVDTDCLSLDDRGFDIWGLPRGPSVTFEDLSSRIHPADRDRVRAGFAATRAVRGNFEMDFRILVEDEARWVSARGQGDDAAMIDHVLFGVFLDVTGRKQAEEAHELLAGEMGHRVKNLLAIASSLTMMTSKSAATTVEMARNLTQRLSALGRAHDLVQPGGSGAGAVALLGDLLALLLAPYDDVGGPSRVRVSAPRLAISEKTAMALALVIHELATNCMKYGALSVPEGTLDVACTAREREIVVAWTERGGPQVSDIRGKEGFGTQLVKRSMTSQLRGSVEYDWSESGLVATLAMPKDQLRI